MLLKEDTLALNRDNKAVKSKLIVFKLRLFSYVRCVEIPRNFLSASAFQRRVQQQMVRDESVRERVFQLNATILR